MSDTRFEPNRAGFARLARGREIQAACVAAAQHAQTIAETLAAEHVRTGDYLRSFQVRPTTIEFAGHVRAAAILENTSEHAAAVEWANAQDPTGYRILGRTLAAMSRV